eukprot:2950500-Amphidinium_carterae.1
MFLLPKLDVRLSPSCLFRFASMLMQLEARRTPVVTMLRALACSGVAFSRWLFLSVHGFMSWCCPAEQQRFLPA